MQERIFLEGSKRTVFLGACQIYSTYVQDEKNRKGGDLLEQAAQDAIKLAKIIDNETCLDSEICDDKDLWKQD
ncbi:MAG: hypothetical protein JSV13_01275 [Nitrospiraceae bacterium]|nr:MAG: hypothetical protein JSV13_01275 [Nitrospiraceae bacterium]